VTIDHKSDPVFAGRQITDLTLAFLAEREKSHPESVFPVIVYFPNTPIEEREVLWPWEDPQKHREYLDQQARDHAAVVQSPLLEFLWQDRKARDCFVYPSSFQFEPVRHVRSLPISGTILVLANRALAETISEIKHVIAVQRDFPVRRMGQKYSLTASHPDGRNRDGATWGWDRLKLAEFHRRTGLTGAGVVIGMIDSGVQEEHADLKFKIKDFAMVGPPVGLITPSHAFDHVGHGTSVASILAGASRSGVQTGGAPAAELKAVAHQFRNDWWSNFLAAAEWLSDRYRAAKVINVSMGTYDITEEEARATTERLFRQMSLHRTIFVASAGNNPRKQSYPARLPEVLSAGAFEPNGDTAPFSEHRPDLILPGSDVYSCVPSGLNAYNGVSYCYRDGSSFAAPHLSAIVALLAEKHPRVAPWRIAQALKHTADRFPNFDDRRGWGVPDLQRALDDLARCDRN
jgi:hypothetical protein